MQTKQIHALTATRAIAALLVVIHHYGNNVWPFVLLPQVFRSGNVAVSYFFVLSGFVLYLSYRDRAIGYQGYLLRRVGRIMPSYLVALLLTVLVLTCFYHYPITAGRSIKEIVFSALLVQGYVPSYPLSLNGPGWSISVEMLFYLVFPALLILQARKKWVFAGVSLILWTAAQAIHMRYYPDRHSLPDEIVDTVFFSPAIHISQFMLGMLAGMMYVKQPWSKQTATMLSYLSVAAIVALLYYRPAATISYQVGLIAPVFMLCIIATAIADPRGLNGKLLVYLGEISYSIYILQLPLYYLTDAINVRTLHLTGAPLFYAYLPILILASAACYRWVEQPVRERMRKPSVTAPTS